MNCDACGKPNARVTRGLKNKRRVLCANCREAVRTMEKKTSPIKPPYNWTKREMPDPEPEHKGGTITESSETETVHYGICRCGWKSPILRYDEMDALNDFAGHINQVIKYNMMPEFVKVRGKA